MTVNTKNTAEFQIGELAKLSGKSVRAIHHYEELGLLSPSSRSKGGFRKYDHNSLARVHWILKLQSMGFSLTDVQSLIAEFNTKRTGPNATSHARNVFEEKLQLVQNNIALLKKNERDLVDAIHYLEACKPCTGEHLPSDCRECDQYGHVPADVPSLFSELTDTHSSDHHHPIKLKRMTGVSS